MAAGGHFQAAVDIARPADSGIGVKQQNCAVVFGAHQIDFRFDAVAGKTAVQDVFAADDEFQAGIAQIGGDFARPRGFAGQGAHREVFERNGETFVVEIKAVAVAVFEPAAHIVAAAGETAAD